MKQKHRTWFPYLVISLVFAAGCLTGWWWSVHWSGATAPAASQVLDRAGEQPAITRFMHLLNAKRFSEAIGTMADQADPQQEQQRAQITQTLGAYLDAGQCDVQQQLLDAYSERFEAGPGELILLARCQMLKERYAAAIDILYDARLLTVSDQWSNEIQSLLKQAVDRHDSLLRSQGQWLTLDYFYQVLLVQDPGNASYYQQLASVRRDSGDLDGAVSALLQIQYDPQLGETARQQLEELQQERASVHQQARIIPLQGEGVRLIVDVLLDGNKELNLLVDTGAAMSVIQSDILVALGYQLAAGTSSSFQTANGEVNAPVVRVDSLAVDDLVQSDMAVGSLALDLGDDVDGLLGMNYLQHYQFSIDYQSRLLYLAPR